MLSFDRNHDHRIYRPDPAVAHCLLVFDPAEAGLDRETSRLNLIDAMVLGLFAKWVLLPQKAGASDWKC